MFITGDSHDWLQIAENNLQKEQQMIKVHSKSFLETVSERCSEK